MKLPQVTIIIVNWNGKTDTLECLDSLRTDVYPNKHIIVVDNGSSDDSVAAIRNRFPEVKVIETGKNLGFTGGNNFGITQAMADAPDYVFLLNNDTMVEPACITSLVKSATSDARIGAVSARVRYFDPPREVWFGGAIADFSKGLFVHDNSSSNLEQNEPYAADWLTGCAMLIAKDVLEQLRGFDDRFYLYCEDVDLSLRIGALNRLLLVDPNACLFHKCGRSARRFATIIDYYHVRNNLLLLKKHAKSEFMAGALSFLGRCLREICHSTIKSPPLGLKRAYYQSRGILDFLQGRSGPFKV